MNKSISNNDAIEKADDSCGSTLDFAKLLPPHASSGQRHVSDPYDFLGLLSQNAIQVLPYYKAAEEHAAPGKQRVSLARRKIRHNESSAGKTIGRNIRDEKRLKNAVENGDFNLVYQLLHDGVDPSCQDDKKRTPLHLAAAKGNEAMVNLLLDGGANPNKKDTIGNTPLHLAACTSHIKVVTLLLKAGTNVNALDDTGRSPLHLATGRLRLLQSLSSYSHSQLKQEVSNIIDMMKEYLVKSQVNDMDELENITTRLQATTTKEEVDEIGGLLSNFASMQLSQKNSSSTTSVSSASQQTQVKTSSAAPSSTCKVPQLSGDKS